MHSLTVVSWFRQSSGGFEGVGLLKPVDGEKEEVTQ